METRAGIVNSALHGLSAGSAGFLADRQFVFLALTNLLAFILAVALAGADFVGAYNLQSMAAQLPELGLLALGVMLAMVSGNGGIDLSGIALANLSGVLATMQHNWIGKSYGMELDFTYEIDGQADKLNVFTTRPDTLMGVSYLAISAEHPLAKYASHQNPAIDEFCKLCKQGSVAEADLAKTEKLGMDTGLFAKHPITGDDVPIWVANYVLMSYGSGAVMGVPAHDERDFLKTTASRFTTV